MATASTIKVVARFRPQNKIEVAAGSEQIVTFDTADSCTIDSSNGGAFTFDRIFPTNTPQADIFNYSIRSTVDDVLAGYNGTVFAYGQTGSGKTYTMMGTGGSGDDGGKGIIPRIVEQIFQSILRSDGSIEFTVKVSYMEIYMEKIRDLLVPQNDNLPIHEDNKRGVYVKGLGEFYVSTVDEVYQVLERGGNARAVASTNMNEESSRSHSIFVIEVTQKNIESGSARSGRLFLVDLAGSEKVGKTGASGQTLEEAKKINKSLSALGMVINALSDGKSSHIPYRDSKLTRILQESLGGNSRTTLIINCSPSSYNDAETMSTLRFGERAKTIKQKAKINEELSPAQLKALLKKAQGQVVSYESYIQSLEGEIGSWRKGESVAREHWTPAMKDHTSRPHSTRETPRPATPSRLRSTQDDNSRTGTPRPESRMEIERSATPSLEKDEKDEFLRRENELQDQLAEKESLLSAAEVALTAARTQLTELRDLTLPSALREKASAQEEMQGLQLQLDKVVYETGEAQITMDSLKEANGEMTRELDEVKQELLEVRISAREGSAVVEARERVKREKMAVMMAGFQIEGGEGSGRDEGVREMVRQLEGLIEAASAGEKVQPDELLALKERLLESPQLGQTSSGATDDGADDDTSLSNSLQRQQSENARLRAELSSLRVSATSTATSTHMHTFDTLKKSLMRDLQNRCERVVELEISLDSTREQYNSILRSSNSKQQAKKLAFLERNLEQLTLVQRGLVEQNQGLKKEVAIAERKLVARGERIRGLEGLVREGQERLVGAGHKYVLPPSCSFTSANMLTRPCNRFESQLLAVKERLEAAKAGSTRGLPSSGSVGAGGFGGSGNFGRIAKPLRGGGGGGGNGAEGVPMVPTFAGLQNQSQNSLGAEKRGSGSGWFFQQRT